MNNAEHQFLTELDAKLWKAADKLRSNMDAANYKHVILGLIFLKYVSDAFADRQENLKAQLQNPGHELYLPSELYDSEAEFQAALIDELEQRDYYTEKHYQSNGQRRRISIYGQEANPTTWKLAAMNMVVRSMDFNFGKQHADSFTNDQHPDLRADFVMAKPPFNLKEWWHKSLENDARWQYGTPPEGNANFAWIQHMLYHLAPSGSMALLLANGSMSSNTGGEGEIRQRLIEADVVECMVALPGQLFTNTQIPTCIWLLSKDKQNGIAFDKKKRNRSGEILFIDARKLGYMKDRVLRDFTVEDTQKIVQAYHSWQYGENYQDEKGFCYSASLADVQKHDYIFTPGRYVGTAEQEDDGEPFAEKMAKLTARLNEQMAEAERLNAEIKKNLAELGW